MKKTIVRTFVLGFFCGVSLKFCLMPAWSAEKHVMTAEADASREAAEPHPLVHSPWLYTKQDSETGFRQIYIQHHMSSSDPMAMGNFSEHRLTTSRFDKTLPQWGPMDVDVSATFLNGSTYSGNCQIYYYLGRSSSTKNDLYMGCMSTSALVSYYNTGDISFLEEDGFADMPLTGVESHPDDDFNIAEYDAESFYPLVFPAPSGSAYNTETLHQLVFINAENKIHHLAYRPQALNVQTWTDGNIRIDHHVLNATVGGITEKMSWDNIGSTFQAYRHPQFFNYGRNIVFSGQDTSGIWNLGTISFSGQHATQITSVGRSVLSPSVVPDRNGYFSFVFSLAMDADHEFNQIAGIDLWMSGSDVFGSCSQVKIMTPSDAHRQSVIVDNAAYHVNATLNQAGEPINAAAKSLGYVITNSEGRSDIAYAEHYLTCERVELTAPIKQTIDDPVLVERVLTCDQSNTEPRILPNYNMNVDHSNYVTQPPFAFLHMETLMDASDTRLVHLYNVAEASSCSDTCTADADGSTLDSEDDVDGDGLRDTASCDNCIGISNADQTDADGDGVGDICEEEEKEEEEGDDTCTGDADGTVLDTADDADADGHRDAAECDNCIGTANADQADVDADGVGDVCEAADDPADDTADDPAAESPPETAESCENNGGTVMDADELGLDVGDAMSLSEGNEVTMNIDGVDYTITPVSSDGYQTGIVITNDAATVGGVVCLSKEGEVGLVALGSGCSLNTHSRPRGGMYILLMSMLSLWLYRSKVRGM